VKKSSAAQSRTIEPEKPKTLKQRCAALVRRWYVLAVAVAIVIASAWLSHAYLERSDRSVSSDGVTISLYSDSRAGVDATAEIARSLVPQTSETDVQTKQILPYEVNGPDTYYIIIKLPLVTGRRLKAVLDGASEPCWQSYLPNSNRHGYFCSRRLDAVALQNDIPKGYVQSQERATLSDSRVATAWKQTRMKTFGWFVPPDQARLRSQVDHLR
jgi:hypothetical protein